MDALDVHFSELLVTSLQANDPMIIVQLTDKQKTTVATSFVGKNVFPRKQDEQRDNGI